MDAYVTALRVPNLIRNLMGEGALSASFVPVLSAFLGERDEANARRLARGILGLVLAGASLLVAIGVAAAPWLVAILAPGYDEELSRLTVTMVRILFPMAGLMIVGAWCMGVLTSHRRFFLPFAAPVPWNLAQVAGLLIGARAGWEPLIVVLAWSTLIGSVLQVAVQIPAVRGLIGGLRPALEWSWEPNRRVARNAAPVAVGQGIFQISSLTDVLLASLIAQGALAGLYYAQILAMLPMAVFGVSVAMSSLPEMSREGGIEALKPHVVRGSRRILYFVLPSAVVLILFGDLVTSIVFERRSFTAADVETVRPILAAYGVGLAATSMIKLFAGAYHSAQDTRTPVKCAAVAVAATIIVGASLMFWLDRRGFGTRAAAGLAVGGAVGAWVNLTLLLGGLRRRGLRGVFTAQRVSLLRQLGGALGAGALAWAVRTRLSGLETGLAGKLVVLVAILAAGAMVYLPVAGLPRRRTGA